MQHTAHEALIVPLARPRLHRPDSAPSAQCRPRADLDLPAHAVAAGRLQLPALADLLGLWRRGHRAVRAVGGRMDDAGAAVALPAFRHLGDRQRADGKAAGRAMVPAVALRTLARRQRALTGCRSASTHARITAARGTAVRLPHCCDASFGRKQCAGKSAATVTIHGRWICWPSSRWASSSLPSGAILVAAPGRLTRPHSSSRAKACDGEHAGTDPAL